MSRLARRLRCLLRGGHYWFVAVPSTSALVACSRCLHGWADLPVLSPVVAAMPAEQLREALPASDDLDLTLRLVEAATGGHPDVRPLLAEAAGRQMVTWRLAGLVAHGATHAERLRDVRELSLFAQLVALRSQETDP